jgi:anti-sigma B factor antagonist
MQSAGLDTLTHALPDGTLIELSGDIDGGARDALDAAYSSAGEGKLLLDFTNVEYINSTGIALIVGLLARARTDQRPVSARGLSEHYREIFEITRLSDFMTILTEESSQNTELEGGDQ